MAGSLQVRSAFSQKERMTMNLFFEEDGAFKVGVILNATDAAYQIELPTGKKNKKLKKSHSFLNFPLPLLSNLFSRLRL